MNLDRGIEGSHWVGLKFDHIKKKIYYICSYGVEPSTDLVKYLNLNFRGYDLLYNDEDIQSMKETYCGHFVVAILYLLNNGLSFDDALDKFKRDPNMANSMMLKKILKL